MLMQTLSVEFFKKIQIDAERHNIIPQPICILLQAHQRT